MRLAALTMLLVASCLATPASAADKDSTSDSAVKFTRGESDVQLAIGGQPVATYVFRDAKIPRPYWANVRTLDGIQVTRNHPVQAGDAADHAEFHPGIWLGFGDVNKHDNWRLKAKVEHVEFINDPSSNNSNSFAVRSRYLAADGAEICEEVCRFTIRVVSGGYLIDWDSAITATASDLAFGDQEEMGLGIRVATPVSVAAGKGGRILDSEGRRNGDAVWGKVAAWCDYAGTIDGQFVGLLVMSDPQAARSTWWHARDYGALVANAFGSRSVKPGEPATFIVKKGESLRLHYGIFVHSATQEREFDPAVAYREFTTAAVSVTATDKTIRPLEHPDTLYAFVAGQGSVDASPIYQVENGELHISGEGDGYLATRNAYRDYHLTVEYKWGKKTDGSKFVRNSGILLHGTGPDGAADNRWMTSIEVQLAQGCEGDFIVIRGKDATGNKAPATLASESIVGADGNTRWKAGGKKVAYSGRQFWWNNHDPEFKELLDTRGRNDVASPLGEWTKVECICRGNRITVKVNGTTVNEAIDVSPSAGKILLQNEGSEIYFRNFELRPIE